MLYALVVFCALLIGNNDAVRTLCKDLPPAQQSKVDCPKS